MSTIYTGSYDNCHSGNLISISGDKGRSKGFEGKCIIELAPKRSFFTVWRSNIGKIPEEDNAWFYIKHYYDEVLSKISVMGLLEHEVDPILLCYEEPGQFCHRHIVAEYLEHFCGTSAFEVSTDSDGKMTIHEGHGPKYIFPMLLEAMKS
jgi:hypothetical protein